jgi:hypothetical protein
MHPKAQVKSLQNSLRIMQSLAANRRLVAFLPNHGNFWREWRVLFLLLLRRQLPMLKVLAVCLSNGQAGSYKARWAGHSDKNIGGGYQQ